MMKLRALAIGTVVLGQLGLGALGCVAHDNERGETKTALGTATVSITYGRPTLKGRDLKTLLKPGQMWRLGADDPTTLESDSDLDFGGTRVPKGKHVLLARLIEPGKWSLVVSSKPLRDYEPSARIAEIPLELEERADPAEEVTIKLSNKGGLGVIEIAWGRMRLVGSFAAAQ